MDEKQKVNDPINARSDYTAQLLLKLTDKSYEMEHSRYDSLLKQSGYLLTGISVISIALLTAIGLIVNADIESSCPCICYILTILSIIGQILALIFALCSQFRYRYHQLSSPEELRKYCDSLYYQDNNDNDIGIAYSSARNFADSLQKHYDSFRRRNDLIRKLNKAASISLLVSISLTLLDVIVFCNHI